MFFHAVCKVAELKTFPGNLFTFFQGATQECFQERSMRSRRTTLTLVSIDDPNHTLIMNIDI